MEAWREALGEDAFRDEFGLTVADVVRGCIGS